jgi:integrase
MTERARGTGTLYQQKDRNGNVLPTWWMSFYGRGGMQRMSTGTTDEKKATKILDQKIAEVKTNTFVDPKKAKVTVDQLFTLSLEHYQVKKRKSLPDFKARWKNHLQPFFGGRKASHVTTELINRYILKRVASNASPCTINRELANLKKMFNYAAKRTKTITLDSVPHIELLEEDENGRGDYVEDKDYPALAEAFGKVGLWARAIFEVGFTFGFRKSEMLGLRIRNINLSAKTIILPPRSTKNKQPRLVVMTERVYQLLKPLAVEKNPDDFLFTRKDGHPVKDFRVIWERCCVDAGVARYVCTTCAPEVVGECKIHGTEKLRWMDKAQTKKVCLSCAPTVQKQCPKCEKATRLSYDGLLVHGLRRTAAINLTMAGVPRQYAKQVTGHQEDKMYDRYSKIARKQMEQTTNQIEAYQRSQAEALVVPEPQPVLLRKAN